MSTPQVQPHKGSRRSSKKQNGQSSRMAVSENEASAGLAPSAEGKGRPRRKSHANKKNTINPDAGVHSDSQTQRSTSHGAKTHATPIKQQAYAGPTFHQSPAASALPIPSFYSKSLPSAGFMKPVPETASRPATQDALPSIQDVPPEPARESTPLDFLFEAARKAHTTPGAESPHRGYLSATGTPSSRSPGPRQNETEFPFEMDSADRTPDEDGLVFTTPYKDRIEALKSTRSTSEGGKSLDDAERVAKTAALKKFLAQTAQNTENAADNPFNARPAPAQTTRHRSNPSTPMQNFYGNNNYASQHYFSPMQYTSTVQMSPSHRPPSSNLRNIYAPNATAVPAELSSQYGAENTRISTARDQTPVRPKYVSSYPTPPPQHDHAPNSTPSTQQLEDDLRRVLKLDLGARG